MSLRPCSAHGARVDHKLSSVYWSWNLPDRSRECYLQRLCLNCTILRVLPLLGQPFEETILCPGCHSPSEDDMQPIFAKVYIPGQPQQSMELPFCSNCFVEWRAQAVVGAELLADRNPAFGGQAPKLSATEVWDSLGLAP